MLTKKIPLAVLGLTAGTRALLGAGVGMLCLSEMKRKKRRKLGWTFLTCALSTIPLAYQIFKHR